MHFAYKRCTCVKEAGIHNMHFAYKGCTCVKEAGIHTMNFDYKGCTCVKEAGIHTMHFDYKGCTCVKEAGIHTMHFSYKGCTCVKARQYRPNLVESSHQNKDHRATILELLKSTHSKQSREHWSHIFLQYYCSKTADSSEVPHAYVYVIARTVHTRLWHYISASVYIHATLTFICQGFVHF